MSSKSASREPEHSKFLAPKSEGSQKPERIDPRVARTKAELSAALLELLTTRRWDKIRVQDILEKTGISRSAFYSHYGNKYDLLIDGIPEFNISTLESGRPDFLPLFEHIQEMPESFRSMLSQPVLVDVMAGFHRSMVINWGTWLADTPDAENWVLHEYLAGAVTAVAKAYMAGREREDPAIVAAEFDRLVSNTLKR